MAAEIRVTPETLEAQGNELVNHAGHINEIMAAIDSKINEIIDGWDGMAQDAYYNLYANLVESLKQFPEIVKALGDGAISAAQAYDEVDTTLAGGFNSAS